ncbi:hypothetical protein BGZ98_005211 [Dissophora globulifera]|nr:hypothetical protein BGZ98_005211 [Dissophora globulifera]
MIHLAQPTLVNGDQSAAIAAAPDTTSPASPTSTGPTTTALGYPPSSSLLAPVPLTPALLSPGDPFTTNIIHDTDDKNLVKTMTLVANAGADAGAAVDAAASARSSPPVLRPNHRHSSSTSSSASSASSVKSATAAMHLPLSGTGTGPRHPSMLSRSSTATSLFSSTAPAALGGGGGGGGAPGLGRSLIENPQPLSPISLHHALDGNLSTTPIAKPAAAASAKIMPRSIDTHVQDTLAKDLHPHGASSPYPGSGSHGHRRIMTPTSRLAETAVGVREVSKKIGRARVKWETTKTVMIVTKPGDESLLKITRELALWMISSRGLTVYVDEKMKDVTKFRYPSFLKSSKLGHDYTPSLKFWTADLCAQEPHLFDFAITLGGDGTVLFTSWLFQRIVPPILPFSAGSLGFLTPFPTDTYQQTLSTCLDHGVRVNLRMRFSCTIYRCLEQRSVDPKKKKRRGNRHRNKGKQNALEEDSDDDSDTRRRQLPTVLTTPTETFEILNDLVLDRGPSANLSLLELFGDEEHLTTVQADGIVISTPTGSTAYSLAAGGPLTHPEIPAILISPICPHTLSFRPMLLPDSMELRICVPFDSRSTAWASFDGRGRVELKQGDHIKVTASVYPFPTICSSSQSSDWFHSLSRCLRWNERERQKGFTVVEHNRTKRNRQPSSASMSPPTRKASSSSASAVPISTTSGGGGSNSTQVGSDHQRHQSHSSHSSPDFSSTLNVSSSGSSAPGHSHGHGLGPGHGHGHGNGNGNGNGRGHGRNRSHSQGHGSGNSSAGSTKGKRASIQPDVVSPMSRRTNQQDYFDQSPQDTDTMLTCWGTDSSCSDDDDSEDDSDAKQDKDDAADGDGEWEEDGSSTDEYDDDDDDDDVGNNCEGKDGGGHRDIATGGRPRRKSNQHEASPAPGNNSSGEGAALPNRTIPNERTGPPGSVEALANKLRHSSLDPSRDKGECPTVVPRYLQERYATTFYGSGDIEPGCGQVYRECCARLERVLSFEAEKTKGGSIAIMTGEGMLALWAGFKSVIPWPFCDATTTAVTTATMTPEELASRYAAEIVAKKYKVLCVGNGVYGSGMGGMVESLRYPNVEVRTCDNAWDQPIDVDAAVKMIQDWKPDLVTMVHCDTPTGVANSAAVCEIGEICSKLETLLYVDIVSSAGAMPVDISGWHVDLGLIGSQKAFSCDPSLAIVSISAKAWKQIEKVAYTGYEALLPFRDAEKNGPGSVYTPLWSALDALNLRLKTMYGPDHELAPSVYAQHEEVAHYCRERIRKMGLKLWWDTKHSSLSSPSVTAIHVPDNTTWRELDAKLRKEGVILGGSYGQTANKLFRVGHMGSQADMETIQYALDVLEKVISE